MIVDTDDWKKRMEDGEIRWRALTTASIAALKVGMKVFPQAGTCSRYAHVVGELVGFTQEHGNTMAVVKFPPVEKYNEYFQTWMGWHPYWNRADWGNPFDIYKNETTATFYPASIDVVTDDSIKPGDLVDEKVWWNSAHPTTYPVPNRHPWQKDPGEKQVMPELKKVELT